MRPAKRVNKRRYELHAALISERKLPASKGGPEIMSQSKIEKKYSFDRPGDYRIRVQGFLDESWSERLGGLRITTSSLTDQGVVTELVGQVCDQAELSGVLNTLYELHLTLLSVEHINGE